jgi:galactose oxidase-like protein
MTRFLWTQKEDIGPSARFGHAMCYDSARQCAVLFGGDGPQFFGDTWTWSGGLWTQVADTGPSPRRDHSMTFDSAHGVALLFGGISNNVLERDTWTWDGENWTQVEDTGAPARSGHGMTFDTARSRVVLFGGDGSAGTLQDTWEWDGNSWTQVEDTGPSPRAYHGLVYDLTKQHSVLFGGEDSQGAALGDTWQWDGTNWTQLQDIGPSDRTRASMVSTDAQVAVFGGLSSANPNPPPSLFGESWTLQNDKWTERQDMGPPARWGHAMAFDVPRRTIILFGGRSSAAFKEGADLLGDTWEHVETDPPAVPNNQGGGGGQLAQITLNPTSANPGQQVTAEVSLTAPGPVTTDVTVVWVLQSVIDNANNSNTGISQADIHPIGQVQIPPGSPSADMTFAAPAANESVVVIAYDATGDVGAQLTIL